MKCTLSTISGDTVHCNLSVSIAEIASIGMEEGKLSLQTYISEKSQARFNEKVYIFFSLISVKVKSIFLTY